MALRQSLLVNGKIPTDSNFLIVLKKSTES